jgi:hypothetical protein
LGAADPKLMKQYEQEFKSLPLEKLLMKKINFAGGSD